MVKVVMSKHAKGVQKMGLDAYMASQGMDPFYYAKARDGGWCVRGPKDFECAVGDKNLAYILGKILSGNIPDAVKMAEDFVRYMI
jgi:hypothetical protein